MVTYQYVEDIDPKDSIDAEEVDEKVERLIYPLATAFEGSRNLDASFRRLMADQLRQFLQTHRSIRLLMKQRGQEPGAVSDAMSLAREQGEKVYVVALLLESPREWTMRFLKDDWRRHYERYLLDKDERGALPRFKEFLDKHAPDSIERERLQLGITKDEQDFVEFRYRNPGAKTPAHLKAAAKTMDRFPMPGKVIEEVSDATLKDGLRRWQREYGYFSGYSHSGFRKLMPCHIEASKRFTTSQKEEAVEKEYYQAVMFSYLTAASACAEAGLRVLPRDGSGPARVADLDLYLKLDDLWAVMRRAALLGKALWELRVRHIMPPVLGSRGGANS